MRLLPSPPSLPPSLPWVLEQQLVEEQGRDEAAQAKGESDPHHGDRDGLLPVSTEDLREGGMEGGREGWVSGLSPRRRAIGGTATDRQTDRETRLPPISTPNLGETRKKGEREGVGKEKDERERGVLNPFLEEIPPSLPPSLPPSYLRIELHAHEEEVEDEAQVGHESQVSQ